MAKPHPLVRGDGASAAAGRLSHGALAPIEAAGGVCRKRLETGDPRGRAGRALRRAAPFAAPLAPRADPLHRTGPALRRPAR